MDRLLLMDVFVAVAEEKGFAAAARRLNMSPSTVTRAIAALEGRLGVKLLNRTTRHVRVTELGQRYMEDVKRLIVEADAVDAAAAGNNAVPQGHLTVTAPVMFGRMFVLPGIIEYLERHPDVEVSAVFLDRTTNLLEEGLDVGIRIGELPDSSVRALRVGVVRPVFCASPEYLERYGDPQTPQDLIEHTIISSSAGNQTLDWRFEGIDGVRSLQFQPRLTVTNNDSALAAALQHFGVIQLLSYQAAPKLAEGKLKIVLGAYKTIPRPIHIIHFENRYTSAKVRAFIDLMAERLRAEPSLR